MKYILSICAVLGIVLVFAFCRGQQNENVACFEEDFIRIHVVANSKNLEDVKANYFVKDALVEFLIPALSDAQSAEEASKVVENNLEKIEEVAKNSLKLLGANYSAKVTFKNEEVPLRAYQDMVLAEGEYLTLRVDLGEGAGENWWCVVFPAVCFLDTKNPDNFEYVSKIWQIVQGINQKN